MYMPNAQIGFDVDSLAPYHISHSVQSRHISTYSQRASDVAYGICKLRDHRPPEESERQPVYDWPGVFLRPYPTDRKDDECGRGESDESRGQCQLVDNLSQSALEVHGDLG